MKSCRRWFCILLLLLLTACNVPAEDNGKSDETNPVSYYVFEGGSNALIIYEDIVIFPEANSLIEVKIDTLGKPLPASKEEGDLPVMLTFTAGGTTLSSYGKIKVQGSSTARWPKKNWTLKFYADEERTEKLRLKIGDSVASDQWITKAEWVDPTMLRNGLSYRLWERMIKSRDLFPQYEVDNAWWGKNNMHEGVQTGAQGFPESYPTIVKVNDEHYGITMLVLGHDPDNFNIDKGNPKHIYLEFDARGGYTSTKTWNKFLAEGIGKWVNGYYPENKDFTSEQRSAIDELGKFINGSLEDFKKNFDKHLDKANMIDMLLFIEAIYDYDAVAQDIEMVTYDLKKWYMLPWDKDTTFGMSWNESGVMDSSAENLLISYKAERSTQKPWFKTYQAFKPEVEARYAELRDKGVFSVGGLCELAGEITQKIPKEMWSAEEARWKEEGRPSLDETSTSQILLWFERRLKMLDSHFNYSP